MPDSIALTRIHTPEDYWNRMSLAEAVLWHHHKMLRKTDRNHWRCLDKAMQLGDMYHDHWTITRKDYFG